MSDWQDEHVEYEPEWWEMTKEQQRIWRYRAIHKAKTKEDLIRAVFRGIKEADTRQQWEDRLAHARAYRKMMAKAAEQHRSKFPLKRRRRMADSDISHPDFEHNTIDPPSCYGW